MPDLFSPFKLKGVTLRNRIVMSPMTMYNSVDGKLDDYHVSYLGVPQNADRVIREEQIDLVMLGRPALASPHWPIWAARELNHAAPFSLVQEDWRWWLENFRGHAPSIGWPEPTPPSASVPSESA